MSFRLRTGVLDRQQHSQPGRVAATGKGGLLGKACLQAGVLPRIGSRQPNRIHRAAATLGISQSFPEARNSLSKFCAPTQSSRPGQAKSRSRRRKQVVALALRDAHSHYSKRAPGTAWSPIRSIQSLGKFFFITGSATTTAWYSHPYLLNLAAHVLHLDFKDSVTAFQTSFFSFLSLVFAIYSGNTMAFLYERQKAMVQNLYSETMALEELLEESVNTLGPDARDILAQIRVYIDTEILHPENQSPPLGDGEALAIIRSKARNYRRAGTDVGDILHASQALAHAQSERQATACRLLPPVHWALLYTIGALFVSTFILFETGGSFSNEGRHILFTVLCGLMSFVLVALRDLADPAEGVYNATALLETRLSYVKMMLDKYQKLPSGRHAPTGPSASLAVAAPEEISGSNLLSTVVSAIKNVASGDEGDVIEEKRNDQEVASENGSGPRARPVLEAKLQVSTPDVARTHTSAPIVPGGGVTAALGMGRPAGNQPSNSFPGSLPTVRQHSATHWPPHLNGLPPDAPLSSVNRLVGASPSIVSRPRKDIPAEQFRRHLANRAIMHEAAVRTHALPKGGKEPAKH